VSLPWSHLAEADVVELVITDWMGVGFRFVSPYILFTLRGIFMHFQELTY
jgi:hypothetical protein